jgi:hypothetical protein
MFKKTNIYRNKFISVTIFSLVVTIVIILASGLRPPQVPALSQTGAALGIVPATTDPNNPQTKAWFIETLHPGETVERQAWVVNGFEDEREVEIVTKDAIQTTDGTFTYKDNSEKDELVGTWLNPTTRTLKLPGKSSNNLLKFKISVPADAKPGEYAGVIAVQTQAIPNSNNAILVKNRVGARVYITVPGDQQLAVKVNGFDFINPTKDIYKQVVNQLNPDLAKSVHLLWQVQNTGTVYSKTSGKIKISTPSGEVQTTIDQELGPNMGSISRLLPINKPWEVGQYKATLELSTRPVIFANKGELLDQTNPTTYSTEFEVTEAMLQAIQTAVRDLTKSSDPGSQTTGQLNITGPTSQSTDTQTSQPTTTAWMDYWRVGGLILVVTIGLGVGWWLKHRAKQDQPATSAKPTRVETQSVAHTDKIYEVETTSQSASPTQSNDQSNAPAD